MARHLKKLILLLIPVWVLGHHFASLAAETPQIEWLSNGILVNDSIGKSAQKNPKVVKSDGGSHIIVWTDERSGFNDVYAQRIDPDGTLLWGENGVAVCKDDRNQSSPQVCPDNAGGVIVVWEDYRGEDSDIYVQKLSREGKPLWSIGGVPVCQAKTSQLSPKIIPDGVGGAIVTWYDYRSGKGEDIYAQRISMNGELFWQKDGVAVCLIPGTQWYPEIISDDAKGAIIVWTDFRTGKGSDIYGQHLDPSGTVLWQEGGLPICFASENQAYPKITKDSRGGVIVIWDDFRDENFDVYAQRVTGDGKPLWKLNGIEIANSERDEERPEITWTEDYGAIVCWLSTFGDSMNLLAQKLNASGEALWSKKGASISKSGGGKERYKIITASDGGAIVAWEEANGGPKGIFAQKISEDGVTLWDIDGSPVCEVTDDCELPELAARDGDGAILVWQDKRAGNFDIYAQSILRDGGAEWNTNGLVVNSSFGSVPQQNPSIVYDGSGSHIISWEDGREGYTKIYAQKIDPMGTLVWKRDGLAVALADKFQKNPRTVASSGGSTITAWEDSRSGKNWDVYAQRLSADGRSLWAEGGLLASKSKFLKSNLRAVGDGGGGVILVWQEERSLTRQDIYAQKIDQSGATLWGDEGIAVCALQSDQINPAVAADDARGVIVTWVDFRMGLFNSDIYAQKINSKGKPEWKESGVAVCTAPDSQKNPDIVVSEGGGAIICWSDKGGGGYDIYLQSLDRTGKPLLTLDGIAVCSAAGTQRDPRISSDSAGGAIIVWDDFRAANWDIYGQRVDSRGNLLWAADGKVICNAPLTQYSPALVAGDWGVIIAWEDYRNGKAYGIYAQKLSLLGDSLWEENGVAVCAEKDGGRNPKIAPNGRGGAVIAWEDYRSGGSGVFAQKIRAIKID
jgi:hypothetical protein